MVHYKNRDTFSKLEGLLAREIIFQALEIDAGKKPKATFRAVFKKVIKVRKEVFAPVSQAKVLRYIEEQRFFDILKQVAMIMSHNKVVLKVEDVNAITLDSPIHDFFDVIDVLYTAQEEKKNGRKTI